ncbi:hypothetical protein NPIL_26821 [Nephila pilipes]|uniref:Uncharacterized protein n=1 Tax=Nephila pilipes TaxID=299642 RepID=A0A8X6QX90_NEPPI|nr:hypothetical protein NPIL_26821 [Nephila pilipes]
MSGSPKQTAHKLLFPVQFKSSGFFKDAARKRTLDLFMVCSRVLNKRNSSQHRVPDKKDNSQAYVIGGEIFGNKDSLQKTKWHTVPSQNFKVPYQKAQVTASLKLLVKGNSHLSCREFLQRKKRRSQFVYYVEKNTVTSFQSNKRPGS